MKLSYSQLQTFAQCPRKYVLSRMYEPKSKAPALTEGEAFHIALGKAYAQGKPEVGLEAVRFFAADYLSRAASGGVSADQIERMRAKFAVMEAVFGAYGRHVFPVDAGRYEVLATEKPFSIRVDRGLVLEGFIDGIWKSLDTGVRFIVEHKYKSSHDDELMHLDLQVSLYTMAMLEEYGLLPTIYNVILKPQMKPRDGEPTDAFVARVSDVIDKEVSGTVTGYEFESKRFVRRIQSRGRIELQVVADQTKAMYRAMKRVRRDRTTAWRVVGDHCLWMCPYRPICLEEDPMAIDSLYVPVLPEV